jgi:hypothetical protein
MTRMTSVWAFSVTALALGLVIWFAVLGGAQVVVGPTGGNRANLPVVVLAKGDVLSAYGLNKTSGQSMQFHITVFDQNGAIVQDGTCQAPAQGFCSVSAANDAGGNANLIALRSEITASCFSIGADAGSSTCLWAGTYTVSGKGGLKAAGGSIVDGEVFGTP